MAALNKINGPLLQTALQDVENGADFFQNVAFIKNPEGAMLQIITYFTKAHHGWCNGRMLFQCLSASPGKIKKKKGCGQDFLETP
jgi:hypothetical protein